MDKHDYNNGFNYLFGEILQLMTAKSNEKIRLRKINPNMYQKALNEFVRFGKLMHYPEKHVYYWKDNVINNFMYLDVITMFFGHSNYFDTDAFNDYVFNTDETGESINDWSEAWEYIEEMGYDIVLENILPQFSNGHDLISDYGLEPLREIIMTLMENDDPNEIIVLINKALDISHQRSDLSELFIEGGEASLNRISGLDENIIRIIKEEINNYHGEHTAPKANSDDAPMHDLTDIYGDDIYGYDAARMYSHYGDNRDYGAINIIQSAKNKPNKPIKIYRAVPDINYDIKTNLKPLLDIYNYYIRYKFFPMKNKIVYALDDKYPVSKYGYEESQKLILNDINNQITELQNQQQKGLGINDGDWVTIDRNYAKEHGVSNLKNKFKIVSKTVPARQLFTDGNDIFEWSYSIN